MVLRRCFIHFLLIIYINTSYSQRLNVAIFHEYNIRTIVFSAVTGEYVMTGDGEVIKRSSPDDIYFVTSENGILTINDKIKSLGKYRKIEFSGTGSENSFQLNPAAPSLSSREYDNDLLLACNQTNILVINKVDIEKYITGVIEAEGGPYAPLEFYKAQAILVRTYAINNMYKHSSDGFNLCDGTHCQAYKGKSRFNTQIYTAARATKGKVLADRNNNLITTPYHSNCGGQTTDASDVWQKDLPNMVSVRDPFCTESRNAAWDIKISVTEWENYLRKNGISIINSVADDYVFSQFSRKKYYRFNDNKILLTKIRKDWNLKSTYFSIIADKNSLVLKGKGFGHGVGLCQEGAIEMANVGYTYPDILHFYFRNVKIIDYKKN